MLNADCLTFNVDRMSDAAGPEVLAGDNYNLSADVSFMTTGKCGQFNYGNGHKSDGVPAGDAPVPPAQQQRPQPISGGGVTPPAAGAAAISKPKAACKARRVKVRGPLRSFRTACPSFGASKLTVTFRLKKGARVRVDLLRGTKVVKRVLKLRTRKASRTYTLKLAPKGIKAGNYTLRLRATRAGRTTTLKLPVTRTR